MTIRMATDNNWVWTGQIEKIRRCLYTLSAKERAISRSDFDEAALTLCADANNKQSQNQATRREQNFGDGWWEHAMRP